MLLNVDQDRDPHHCTIYANSKHWLLYLFILIHSMEVDGQGRKITGLKILKLA